MVDVCMGKNHEVYFLRINRKIAVLLECFFPVSLIETAIEKYPLPAGFHEMH